MNPKVLFFKHPNTQLFVAGFISSRTENVVEYLPQKHKINRKLYASVLCWEELSLNIGKEVLNHKKKLLPWVGNRFYLMESKG